MVRFRKNDFFKWTHIFRLLSWVFALLYHRNDASECHFFAFFFTMEGKALPSLKTFIAVPMTGSSWLIY